jgi:hypothetical protein
MESDRGIKFPECKPGTSRTRRGSNLHENCKDMIRHNEKGIETQHRNRLNRFSQASCIIVNNRPISEFPSPGKAQSGVFTGGSDGNLGKLLIRTSSDCGRSKQLPASPVDLAKRIQITRYAPIARHLLNPL